jgi:LysR family hydrogen peroxide-inducible transcriptional activator
LLLSLTGEIQKIEEELSIQIFDRTKIIQLTDIGHKIVKAKILLMKRVFKDIVEQQGLLVVNLD